MKKSNLIRILKVLALCIALLIMLYQPIYSAKFPYPIIFVHGISDRNKSWEKLFKEIRPLFNIPSNIPENNISNGIVFHALLNASSSTNIWGNNNVKNDDDDDVIYKFIENEQLQNSDIYFINFDCYWNEDSKYPTLITYPVKGLNLTHPGDNYYCLYNFDSKSNESAVYKQGYALSKAIDAVLKATGSEKVILVGHSMGGLSIREYLQRYENGNPKWWEINIGHHVAKVITIGTPHYGSDLLKIDAIGNFIGLNTIITRSKSEALRDLRKSSVYLNNNSNDPNYECGAFGEDIINLYFNQDINCNGNPRIDDIPGLNSPINLPSDISFTYIVSSIPYFQSEDCGDRVVTKSSQYVRYGESDTIETEKYHNGTIQKIYEPYSLIPGMKAMYGIEMEDYLSIMRALDEPNVPKLAFQLHMNQEYSNFANIGIYYNTDYDYDWYKVAVKGGLITIRLSNLLQRKGRIDFYENEPTDANSIYSKEFDNLPETEVECKPGLMLNEKEYYIRITHYNIKGPEDTDCDWNKPFTITVEGKGYFVDVDFRSDKQGVVVPNSNVQFTDLSINNGNEDLSYEWDFGDGTPNSYLKDPSHTYTEPGQYSVRLKINAYGTNFEKTLKNYIWVNPPDCPNIVKAEYFFDDDPGFGNASSITFTADNFQDIEYTIDLSDVTLGLHRLYLRVMDENGKWSHLQSRPVLVENTETYREITNVEYFLDSEPGFGNGTTIPIGKNLEVNIFPTINLTNISEGLHRLYIRAKDNKGKWSMPQSRPVLVQNIEENKITDIEFFYRRDPGKGQGNSIDIEPNYEVLVDDRLPLYNRKLGKDTIYIRAKNDKNVWGIPQSVEFTINDDLIAPELLYPIANEKVTASEINFQWTNIGAKRYELIVDNDKEMNSPEVSTINFDTLANFKKSSYKLCGNWLSDNKIFWKIKAVFFDGRSLETPVDSFNYNPTKNPQPQWAPIYRAYYQNDVDHFYCTSDEHLKTAINGNYDFEKVEGYVSIVPFETEDLKPIYRLYIDKDKSHVYTTEDTKKDYYISMDTTNLYEGIIGYTYGTTTNAESISNGGLVKLYYTFFDSADLKLRDHFYTTSEIEKNNSIRNGYVDSGFIAYVSPFGRQITEPEMDAHAIIGNGINVSNGNFNYTGATVFDIPGAGLPLRFEFNYNSNSTRLIQPIIPMGPGWNHTYNSSLIAGDSLYYIFWSNGSIHLYNKQDLKSVTNGVYNKLIKDSGNRYKVITKEQIVYIFNKFNDNDSTAVLSQIADRNGNQLDCIYQNDGTDVIRLKSVVSTVGNRKIEFIYFNEPGKNHLIKEAIDPMNRIVKFDYDNNNNLIQFTDANGFVTNYYYDSVYTYDHLLTKIKLPENNFIENIFEIDTLSGMSSKRIISQCYGDNEYNDSLHFTFHSQFNTIQMTNKLGEVDYFLFDNTPEKKIEGIVTSQSGSNYEYTDTLNPALPTKMTDGMGYKTNYLYDQNGNVLEVNLPNNTTHKFEYNEFNDVTKYSDPKGISTQYYYDEKGNLLSITNPRGKTEFRYNQNGTIAEITNPMNEKTRFEYNDYGNITKIVDNIGNKRLMEYDIAGRVIKRIDERDFSSDYAYNGNDFLTKVKNPMSKEIKYQYTQNNNLSAIINQKSDTTKLSYTSTGLLKSITNPLNQITSYDYDYSGQVVSITKPDGNKISCQYNNLGQYSNYLGGYNVIPAESRPDSIFVFNKNGNLISINTESEEKKYISYDSLNRITKVIGYFNDTISYSYDLNSNITEIIYPGGKRVSYTFYDDNLLKSLEDWHGNLTSYYYRSDGLLDSVQYGNGTNCKYDYDGTGRLIAINHKRSDGTIIFSNRYILDNAGNQLSVDSEEPFPYDPLKTGVLVSNYDRANRIDTSGKVSYKFDNNGNMTEKDSSGIITKYFYDSMNRLVQTIRQDTVSYSYDALGTRIASIRSGMTTRYVIDNNSNLSRLLVEMDSLNNPVNYYIYGLGLVSRLKTDGTVQYYHSDSRGSTITMTDSDQNLINKYSYDTYGQLLKMEETDHNPFRFVGAYGVMDEGNGLYFMRARYYDAASGRFLTEDPVWDLNLYGYAGNNPVMNIDPEGKLYSNFELLLGFKEGGSGFNVGLQSLRDVYGVFYTKKLSVGQAIQNEIANLLVLAPLKIMMIIPENPYIIVPNGKKKSKLNKS